MADRPMISLIIPTNGALEWIAPCIKSIVGQAVHDDLYEIVVVDNARNIELSNYIKSLGRANVKYAASSYEGFDNTFYCFRHGNGLFRKMLNHRTLLRPGVLEYWLSIVDRYKATQPILYFLHTDRKQPAIAECGNEDEFVKNIGYWFTWSLGVGMWERDVAALDGLRANHYFPHATILFDARRDSRYVVVRHGFQLEQDDTGKGGYDLFRYFAVEALNIVEELQRQGRVAKSTSVQMKNRLRGFLSDLYLDEVLCKSRHTFVIRDVDASLGVHYGKFDIMRLKTWAHLRKFLKTMKGTVMK